MKTILAFLGLLLALPLTAQVGINILQPDSSAVLHLESTDRGFLPPRMSRQQRDNIQNPKPGLTVYNATDSVMEYFNGNCWLAFNQSSCDDCAFDFSMDNPAGHIDRVYSNRDSAFLYLHQRNGFSNDISVYIIPNLPAGISASLDQYVVNGSDTIQLTVEADIFAPPGIYPVIVQAVCGNTVGNQVFVVAVDSCMEVYINSPQSDYDLQAANALPTAVPICVLATIGPGVVLDNPTAPAVFTTGGLHPDSKVGILNQGTLLARGGDGGAGAGASGGGAGTGFDGTHAISLTVDTDLRNQGRIYSGGGGGGSVGLIQPINLGIGTYNLGIGAGGGGGAADGAGGNLGSGFGYYEPGQNAGTGAFAQGGRGGALNNPYTFNLFGADFTITPNVYGGDGGGYGEDGQAGYLFVNVLVQIGAPVVGTITLYDQDFPDPPNTNFPVGGTAGFAVKRNGHSLLGSFIDGYYLSGAMKGYIGN